MLYAASLLFVLAFLSMANASSSESFDYDHQDLWKSLELDANECSGDANSPINVPAGIAADCSVNSEGIQLNVSWLRWWLFFHSRCF